MKRKMILLPSERMDNNKKPGRNENSLVRVAKTTRELTGFEGKVELYRDGGIEAIMEGSTILDVFQAYKEDIKKAAEKGVDPCDACFVTSPVYNHLAKGVNDKDQQIWISDKIEDIVLGADPEFLLFDGNGDVVHAYNILAKEGSLGSDGAMAELRPFPALTPEGLVDNIRKIFETQELVEPIEPYSWIPGCYFRDYNRDYPVGGHIHIGNPGRVQAMPEQDRSRLFVVTNKILDEMVSVPFIKVDGTDKGKARRTGCMMGNYGWFGDWRQSNGHFEFRTLSGLWMSHPKFATLVIGTVNAVVSEIMAVTENNGFDPDFILPKKYQMNKVHYSTGSKLDCPILWKPGFDEWDDIPLAKALGSVTPSETMVEHLNGSDEAKVTKEVLSETLARFKKMSSYDRYSHYVDGFFEVLESCDPSDFEAECGCMRESWLGNKKFMAV